MSETKPGNIFDRYALGIFFAIIGATCLVAIKFHHTRSLTNPNDPGPWLMPTLLGSLLLVGGLAFVISNVRFCRTGSSKETHPDDRFNFQPWTLLAGVVAYVLLLPWIGFLIATPMFVFTMLWWLKIVWWKAIIAAILLTLTGQLVFVWGFMTPLPTGFWN